MTTTTVPQPYLVARKNLPGTLFWCKPLPTETDFTPEDPLAFDYLAQQVGLWLFRGFTTRTSRAQYYPVVLYGLHLANLAIKKHGLAGDDQTRTRLFERWERFWALACLQSHGGALQRGHADAMRGIRGAARTWKTGDKPLPIDFPLISRQSELGALGAYLTSLREYRLVGEGSLTTTPAAQEIINTFWSEATQRDMRSVYDAYALLALDPGVEKVPRTGPQRRLALATLGERTRLTAICERVQQQQRLWSALFEQARDSSTLSLAYQLIAAEKHVTGPLSYAERVLTGIKSGEWGAVPAEVLGKVQLALAFGQVNQVLLDRFNRAYALVNSNWSGVRFSIIAADIFSPTGASELRQRCSAVLDCHERHRFSKLEFHGKPFMALLERLLKASPEESLRHLLAYHQQVQKSRHGASGWLTAEGDKLLMKRPGYSGFRSPPTFPDLKLSVVRQLLSELGKLHAA